MTTASEALGAAEAGGQPAATSNQAEGATTNGAVATTNGAGAPATAAPAERLDWLGEAPDELHEFARANGYKGPADVLTNVRELQKYLGADKAGRGLVLPKDADDADGWSQVYAKLGRPETPDGYGLTKLEGADPDFAAKSEAKLHELGLSTKQAQALAEWWGAEVTELVGSAEARKAAEAEAAEASFIKSSEEEMQAFEAQFGDQKDAMTEVARRGAQAFGFSAEELDKIERSIGTKALMQRFLEVGKKLGEDVLPGGRQAGHALTPATAQEQIAQKLNDREFMAKVRSGDPTAKGEMDRLYQAAYPG